MESKKTKTNAQIKTNKPINTENKLVVTSEGGERGELQTTEYKIGLRMYCTTRGIEPMFCNKCKWKVTLKICINFF